MGDKLLRKALKLADTWQSRPMAKPNMKRSASDPQNRTSQVKHLHLASHGTLDNSA